MTPQEEAIHPETSPQRLWELAVSHYDSERVNLLLLSIKPGKKIPVIKALKNFSRVSLYTAKKWTDDMPCFINRKGLRKEDAEQVKAIVSAEGGEIELRPKATPTPHAALVAQNPSTPIELLWALGACDEPEVREAVCRHPLIPGPLLYSLGVEFPRAFLQNPITQLSLLENPTIYHQWPESLKIAVMSLTEIGESTLREILQKSSSRERKAVLSHPSLSESFLEEMSHHNSEEIRQELADSPRASLEMLTRLSQDPSVFVRGAVAANPRTPVTVLRQMRGVDNRIAQNPNTPVDLLMELAETGNEDVLFHLQRHRLLPAEVLETLAKSPRESVRVMVASHENTSKETLEKLSLDEKNAVLSEVAKNKNTPKPILEKFLAQGETWLVADLASNESLPTHLFSTVAALLKETGLKEALLQNPNLPEAICAEQLEHLPVPTRRAYASNTTLRGMLLNLARDTNREVRVAVAQNPHATNEIIELLSKDPEPTIRQQVALRYSTNIPWQE